MESNHNTVQKVDNRSDQEKKTKLIFFPKMTF